MSSPLVFHPDVYDEVDQAYRWYEQRVHDTLCNYAARL